MECLLCFGKVMIIDNDQFPDGKGKIDMCKAVKEMPDESKTKGLAESRTKGFSQLFKLIEPLSD